jgi:hypothetical protein
MPNLYSSWRQPIHWRGHHREVPRISEFHGIALEMYYRDHSPPHFHVRYAGQEAIVEISTGDVIAGSLPGRAERLVREWARLHRDELHANWQRARAHEATEPIEPLR